MREVGWKMGRMERRSGLSGVWSFLSVVHVTVESWYPRSHCVVWQGPFRPRVRVRITNNPDADDVSSACVVELQFETWSVGLNPV